MLKRLYETRKIVVWVEDELTREYLRALWQDERISFAVAGGRDGVSQLTNTARSKPISHKNVFGIRDRDFGETNLENWGKTKTLIFKLPQYEIENYLLDWEALLNCRSQNLKRDASEIQHRVKKRAKKLIWWAACKRTLSSLHFDLTETFPKSPKQNEASDHAAALNYILTTKDWHSHICSLPGTSLTKSSISDALTKCHAKIKQIINDGKWPNLFPGKPLFREARSYVCGQRGQDSKGYADVDLARKIAEWQVKKNSPPSELIDLRNILLKRLNLPIANPPAERSHSTSSDT